MKFTPLLALSGALLFGIAPVALADGPAVQVASISLDWRDAAGNENWDKGSVTITVRATGAVDVVDATRAAPYTRLSARLSPAQTDRVFAALDAARVGELPQRVSAPRDDASQRAFELIVSSHLQGDRVNSGSTSGLFYFVDEQHQARLQPVLDAFALAEDLARGQLFDSVTLGGRGRDLVVSPDGRISGSIVEGGVTRRVRGVLTLAELRRVAFGAKAAALGMSGQVHEADKEAFLLTVESQDDALRGATTVELGNAMMLAISIEDALERILGEGGGSQPVGPPPGSTPGFLGPINGLGD